MNLGKPTQLSEAFARIKPRERLLLGVLLLIALIFAPLRVLEMRTAALDENRAAHETLAAAKQAARRAGGSGLAASLERTRDEVRDWSYSAPSPAVGQVMAQNELSEIAAAAGLAGAQVSATGKPVDAGAVTLVGVEVEAPFSWSGLSGFLAGLSESGKGFVLESIRMTEDKTPKLELVLRLPVTLAEANPA